jgi:hypothetical protein
MSEVIKSTSFLTTGVGFFNSLEEGVIGGGGHNNSPFFSTIDPRITSSFKSILRNPFGAIDNKN